MFPKTRLIFSSVVLEVFIPLAPWRRRQKWRKPLIVLEEGKKVHFFVRKRQMEWKCVSRRIKHPVGYYTMKKSIRRKSLGSIFPWWRNIFHRSICSTTYSTTFFKNLFAWGLRTVSTLPIIIFLGHSMCRVNTKDSFSLGILGYLLAGMCPNLGSTWTEEYE